MFPTFSFSALLCIPSVKILTFQHSLKPFEPFHPFITFLKKIRTLKDLRSTLATNAVEKTPSNMENKSRPAAISLKTEIRPLAKHQRMCFTSPVGDSKLKNRRFILKLFKGTFLSSLKMNIGRCVNVISGLPTPVAMPQSGCFSGCCSCVNFSFLKTTEGIIKLAEIILGGICQNLLISYGFTYSLSLGSSYYSFLTTVSASVLTSLVLLICYVVSQGSFHLVRQSLFETLFNGITSFLYLSSSCYLALAVYTFLYPVYKISSIFQVYPAMSATYIVGFILGSIHGYDSWLAYKKFR